MVINSQDAEPQQLAAATMIHINTLRLLLSCLMPLAARNAKDPKRWMEELEQLAMTSADFAAFEGAGHVNPELMKAAVIGALEEVLGPPSGALKVFRLSPAEGAARGQLSAERSRKCGLRHQATR